MVPAHRTARWDQVIPAETNMARVIRITGGGTSRIKQSLMAACMTLVVSTVLLVVMSPPMVLRKVKKSYEVGGISILAVLVWALIAATAAGCMTYWL